jgi:hypothetical protein
VCEADGSYGGVAEPPNERQVGRHHGDLTELGQRHGPRQFDRFDDLGAPNRTRPRRCGRRDVSWQCHLAAP